MAIGDRRRAWEQTVADPDMALRAGFRVCGSVNSVPSLVNHGCEAQVVELHLQGFRLTTASPIIGWPATAPGRPRRGRKRSVNNLSVTVKLGGEKTGDGDGRVAPLGREQECCIRNHDGNRPPWSSPDSLAWTLRTWRRQELVGSW